MIEIERKFLVKDDNFLKSHAGTHFIQGYLSKDPERAVRVRIAGDLAFLTIKGKSNASGTSRYEWEKEIAVSEAQELLNLCLPGIIEKTRYVLTSQNTDWEVDVFAGVNKGLTIAEIELKEENQQFAKPVWLGKEVTGDHRYYNAYLSEQPYGSW